VVVVGEVAYLACFGLGVIDVSDPTSPKETVFHLVPGDAVAVAVVGEYIYLACREGGLVILRMTP